MSYFLPTVVGAGTKLNPPKFALFAHWVHPFGEPELVRNLEQPGANETLPVGVWGKDGVM